MDIAIDQEEQFWDDVLVSVPQYIQFVTSLVVLSDIVTALLSCCLVDNICIHCDIVGIKQHLCVYH